MNSSLAAVAETDYQPFTPPFIDRQRKVLSVRNLSKSYSAQQTVLDGISFDLHAGELVGVIGRSGAGKSTLLHVLNGTHRASGGEILSYPEVGTPQDVSKLSGRALNAWRSQCGMIPGAASRRFDQRAAGPPEPDLHPEIIIQSFPRRGPRPRHLPAGMDEYAAACATAGGKPLRRPDAARGDLPGADAKPGYFAGR